MKKITKIILLSLIPMSLFAGINNDRAWMKGKSEGEYMRNSEGSKALANASSLCTQSWSYYASKYSGYKNDFMRGCMHGIRK